MPTAASSPTIVRFDDFEADLASCRLVKGGRKIDVREKSFQALALLLEHAGRVVTREELRQRLWPGDVFVDFDNNLNITVARLRQALCDSSEHPRFIETVPRHGYRFLGTVSRAPASPSRAADTRARMVVLPFVHLSNDASLEHFTDAVTDATITALARIAPEHLAVIARTTAMCYKGTGKDIDAISRDLAVRYALEGAVRFVDGHASINVQLIRAEDQSHLFAQSYSASLDRLFDLQPRIAQDVAAHVCEVPANAVRADRAYSRGSEKGTEDRIAFLFYLQGRQQIQFCWPDPATAGKKAAEYQQHAISRDPQFAEAYAAMAEVCWWQGFLGLDRPRHVFQKGIWAALRALENNPKLAYAHTLIGMFRAYLDYDWPEVQREMETALQLDPECLASRFWHAAHYLLYVGKVPEAITELERVLESDPLERYVRFWLVWAHIVMEDYAAAEAHSRFLIEMAPDGCVELRRARDLGHLGLGIIHCCQGRYGEAVDELRVAVELSSELPSRLALLGAALAWSGAAPEARDLLDRLHRDASHKYVPATTFGFIHLALGHIEEGLGWLERAVNESDPIVVGIGGYPYMRPLRGHPRFAALLRRMRLPD